MYTKRRQRRRTSRKKRQGIKNEDTALPAGKACFSQAQPSGVQRRRQKRRQGKKRQVSERPYLEKGAVEGGTSKKRTFSVLIRRLRRQDQLPRRQRASRRRSRGAQGGSLPAIARFLTHFAAEVEENLTHARQLVEVVAHPGAQLGRPGNSLDLRKASGATTKTATVTWQRS